MYVKSAGDLLAGLAEGAGDLLAEFVEDERTSAGMAGKRIETALVMARCGHYGEAVEYLQSAERFLMEAEASKGKAELVRAVTEL